MADVTVERMEPAAASGPSPETAARRGPEAPADADGIRGDEATPAGIDPRAVRVAIGPGTFLADEAPMVVSPPPAQLVPPQMTLAGTGLLGGAATGQAPASQASADWAPDRAAGRTSADRAAAADDKPGTGATRAFEADEFAISDAAQAAGPTVLVDGEAVAARLVRRGPGRASLVVGEGSAATGHRVVFTGDPVVGTDGRTRRELVVDGWRIEIELESERRAALRERARRGREATAHGGPTEVRAIIPGRVVSVSVAPGDPVTAGQQVLVVEAMKMQNELRAPRDGTIRTVAVAPGVTIEVGDLLLVIE